MDSETEELIQQALDELAGKRTIIVVAHRLSSVRHADRVVVIEDGRIVEQGRPTGLLNGETPAAANCSPRNLFRRRPPNEPHQKAKLWPRSAPNSVPSLTVLGVIDGGGKEPVYIVWHHELVPDGVQSHASWEDAERRPRY